MTITSGTTSVRYAPDGAQTAFAVPFRVFHAHDVRAVSVEGARETPLTGYAVEGIGTEGGVRVRFFTPPAKGATLVLYRWLRRVQESGYPEGGRFPSAVVEMDLDRLAAMAQEEEDMLRRAVLVPREAQVTPEEYMAAFFSASDAAHTSSGEARASATAARNAACAAERQAADAALQAQAAAASALEAAETATQGQPSASETVRGVTRYGTAAEHYAGAANVAATPEHVRAMLHAEDGHFLLEVVWSVTGLAEPGYLDISRDNGLLFRSEYSRAWEKVARAMAANTGAVAASDAAWLAERDANGGVCGKFSPGDGVATFRVPLLRGEVGIGSPDPARGIRQGAFVRDRFQGFAVRGYKTDTQGTDPSWAERTDSVAPGFNHGQKVLALAPIISNGMHGEPRMGATTHGPLVVWTPLMKMRGGASE